MSEDPILLEIRRLAPIVRNKIAPYGSMCGMWDWVFDAEALLKGSPTVLTGSPDEIKKEILAALLKADATYGPDHWGKTLGRKP